jgi:hypothetical protein
MKDTAKILTFKGKELKTVNDGRAALSAILEDLGCGRSRISLLCLWSLSPELNTKRARVTDS